MFKNNNFLWKYSDCFLRILSLINSKDDSNLTTTQSLWISVVKLSWKSQNLLEDTLVVKTNIQQIINTSKCFKNFQALQKNFQVDARKLSDFPSLLYNARSSQHFVYKRGKRQENPKNRFAFIRGFLFSSSFIEIHFDASCVKIY